jgi:hypothetical protein
MVLSFAELALFTGEQKQGSVTARLATASARRFVTRHLSERNSWAATTGLKTSSFMIDHDPDGMLHSELPASVMQIRAEEIQRCISDVLGRTYLHNYVIGHRVFGALDPEQSLRTCVDTLRMFACLYLDAGPLVERRIKGLAALLPIVDPGLAKVMRPKDIGALIRRNLWFFHFDFGWIDQRVIHTPRATRYDVNIASLSSRIRQAMMDYLEKTGGVGNFVWIGPEARDRLLQEAPAMAHVIETCPVNADDGKDEMLMFIIKFEHLIPRLQRYFDLDSMRQSLLDFEPSGESTRLLNLLGLQVAKARSPGELMEVLSSVASVPWRGFREKDNALQLILAAFNRLSELVSPGKSLAESTDPAHRPLHDKILDAVRTVGYPSQMLHAAQVAKIALRDVKLLAEVAVDPSSPRFTEAWLIMSTTDYYRHSESNRRAVLELLKSLPDRPRLGKSRLVQAKAVDALASIGRVTRAEEQPLLDEVAARLGVWLPASGADLDVCCLFLDAQLFLASHLKRELKIEPAVVSALDRHIQLLTNELGTADPQVIAIMSRWQEYTGRRAAALSAA